MYLQPLLLLLHKVPEGTLQQRAFGSDPRQRRRRAQSGQRGNAMFLYVYSYREFMDRHLWLIAKSALAPLQHPLFLRPCIGIPNRHHCTATASLQPLIPLLPGWFLVRVK